MNDYEEIGYEVKEVEDKRITKYSFFKNSDHKEYYFGPKVIKLISSRYDITKDKYIA